MRVMCYKCFWPQALCWCASLRPMATRTRFVFLMHPKEFKEEKAGTGRLTHLCLPNSEIHMGTAFDGDEAVQALINDPEIDAVAIATPVATHFSLAMAALRAGVPGPDQRVRRHHVRQRQRPAGHGDHHQRLAELGLLDATPAAPAVDPAADAAAQ